MIRARNRVIAHRTRCRTWRPRLRMPSAAACLLLLAFGLRAPAAEPEADALSRLHRDMQAVQEQLADLNRQVADIMRAQALFMRSAEPEVEIVTLPVRPRPGLGDTNAPLVLVEFIDPRCQFSRLFHNEVLPELRANFIDRGHLRLVGRTYALHTVENSHVAANALLGAGALDKFWAMQGEFFARQGEELTRDAMIDCAEAIGLDADLMESILDEDAFGNDVQEDRDDARAAGISGTPAFVLGSQTGDTITGERLAGLFPLSFFEARIHELLRQRKQRSGSRFSIETIGVHPARREDGNEGRKP